MSIQYRAARDFRTVRSAALASMIVLMGCAGEPDEEIGESNSAIVASGTTSLFLSSDIPSVVNVNDRNSVELGVKFSSTKPGKITSLRFYKGSQDTGTHTAHLWSASGQLLTSATFGGETSSGWQQVNFPAPVTIAANTTYVASYHTNGFYSASGNYFTKARTNGPLTAPAGNNGVYAYGSAVAFPSNSYRSTNYWVDVVFSASATETPPSTPPPSTPPPSTGSNPWSVPFLGRTPSGQIVLRNQSNVTISGKQFVNLPRGQDAIVIENCTNVTITGNDFSGNTGNIYALNSRNVTVTWNRYQNVGDGTIGGGHSNFVQFNQTTGGYIGNNKGIGGNTEDIISIYMSQGASASSPIVIENNAFEGTNWTSGSGSGSMLGDYGSSHIVVRNNTYLNPGQVGIGVAGGTDIHLIGNVVYGARRAKSNVGIYVWNQSDGNCSGIEVRGNKVNWVNEGGSSNPYWNAGNCGTIDGESTNTWNASINSASLHVVL